MPGELTRADVAEGVRIAIGTYTQALDDGRTDDVVATFCPDGSCEMPGLGVFTGEAALREAYTSLPTDCQQLVSMLTADPPVPYAEISARLAMPVGSIGPTRSRCLDRMRRYPAIAALINASSYQPMPVVAAAS